MMQIDAPNREQIPVLRHIWQEAFGDTEDFLHIFEKTAFAAERCRCVTVDGTPAAVLYWFDCLYRGQKIAYLYAVATASAYRGQGLCHMLMDDTHKHLKARRYAGTVLVPGSRELFRLYEGMGYRTCGWIREFCCDAGRESADIRRIGQEEYAALRRRYLVQDGVIQEGENLAFLAAQAELYAGADFVLAARGPAEHEDGTLTGLELLGNPDAAAGIVKALGYRTGRFRTPGTDKPFAMAYPLCDDFAYPAYFGLAFD